MLMQKVLHTKIYTVMKTKLKFLPTKMRKIESDWFWMPHTNEKEEEHEQGQPIDRWFLW